MNDKKDSWIHDVDWPSVIFYTIVIVLLLGGIGFLAEEAYNAHSELDSSESYDIWNLDAPFGRYWTDTHGAFIFIAGGVDSELRESYTVKYLVGDELKTMIFSSTDPNVHIHFVNDTTAREFRIEQWHYALNEWTSYHVYIPDPKVLDGDSQ